MTAVTRFPTVEEMLGILKPTPAEARLAALQDCYDRYQAQITAQLAVLELAQAQGNEAEVETALVEIACAVAARTVAANHLERMARASPPGGPPPAPEAEPVAH